MNFLIGLDIGTSAVKGVLLSCEGEIIATKSSKFNYYNKGTERLLKPADFLDSCFSVINFLAEQLHQKDEIAAICSCCASGSLVFLDENYEPLYDIVGWQTSVDDNEFSTYYTDQECDDVYNTVGWPVLNGFPVAYLPWVRNNNKKLLTDSKMICMAAEYLNFKLCGQWGISHSMSTPFYLLDQEKGIYNEIMLEKLGINEKQLPPVYSKGTVIGNVLENKKINLSKNTKVVLGSFDHPSGATGAGVYNSGEMLLSCGTSWVEFFPVESRKKAIDTKLLVDRFMLDGAPYCVMSSLTSVSEKIDSFRNHYLGDISHKEYDKLISGSKLGCNGLSLDLNEEIYPKLDNYSKCDIARAIIEASANLLNENLIIAENKGLSVDSITIIGGITNSEICVAVISEVLKRKIKVVNGVSAGAVGSAMLAGIGIGLYKNEKDAYNKMNFKSSVFGDEY